MLLSSEMEKNGERRYVDSVALQFEPTRRWCEAGWKREGRRRGKRAIDAWHDGVRGEVEEASEHGLNRSQHPRRVAFAGSKLHLRVGCIIRANQRINVVIASTWSTYRRREAE